MLESRPKLATEQSDTSAGRCFRCLGIARRNTSEWPCEALLYSDLATSRRSKPLARRPDHMQKRMHDTQTPIIFVLLFQHVSERDLVL